MIDLHTSSTKLREWTDNQAIPTVAVVLRVISAAATVMMIAMAAFQNMVTSVCSFLIYRAGGALATTSVLPSWASM